MKKSRIITAVVSAVIIAGGIFTFTACSNKIEKTTSTAKANQSIAETVPAETTVLTSAAEITADEAIGIAFNHAGVSEEDALLEIGSPELDKDDAVPHYSIEFTANGFEYDYEIGLDGSIIKNDKEADDDNKTETAPASKVNSEDKTAVENKKNEKSNSAANGFISIDSAKNAALKHAGFKASDVEFKEAKLDTDDGIAHYDIEFVNNGIEYEYEINAQTGKVGEFSKERYVEERTKAPVDTSSFISADEAKAIAFKRAGVNASDASNIKCKLDTDDMFAHYEIEFVSGGFEYDFDINAKTGKIIESDKERV